MMSTAIETPLNLTIESKKYVRHAQEHQFLKFQSGCSIWSSTDSVPAGTLVAPIPVRFNNPASWPHETSLIKEEHTGRTTVPLSPPKPRGPKHPVPDELKDDKYFKRRRRNNEAAKRSRRARRERQQEDLQKIAMAEIENTALRSEVVRLRAEYDTLAQLIAQRHLLHGANSQDRPVNRKELSDAYRV